MIPKVIHRVWLGSPLPLRYSAFAESFRRFNPDYTMRLWSEPELSKIVPNLGNLPGGYGSISNVARLHILNQFGGIYVDCDCLCVRPLDPLLELPAFCGWETEGRSICNAVIGSPAGGAFISSLVESLPLWIGQPRPWGPRHLTWAARQAEGIAILRQAAFYPYRWNEPPPARLSADTYLVHKWDREWEDFKE